MKKIIGLIAVIALAAACMVLTACGGSSSSASLSQFTPEGDAARIVKLITGDENSLVLMEFKGAADYDDITVGYDIYAKGKLVDQDIEMGSVPLEQTGDGLIGIWCSHDRIRTAVSTDEGDSVAAMEGDLPWLEDIEKEGVMTQNSIGNEMELVKGEKLYFYAFTASVADEMSELNSPAEMVKDPSSMKDLDKAYIFYATFK